MLGKLAFPKGWNTAAIGRTSQRRNFSKRAVQPRIGYSRDRNMVVIEGNENDSEPVLSRRIRKINKSGGNALGVLLSGGYAIAMEVKHCTVWQFRRAGRAYDDYDDADEALIVYEKLDWVRREIIEPLAAGENVGAVFERHNNVVAMREKRP